MPHNCAGVKFFWICVFFFASWFVFGYVTQAQAATLTLQGHVVDLCLPVLAPRATVQLQPHRLVWQGKQLEIHAVHMAELPLEQVWVGAGYIGVVPRLHDTSNSMFDSLPYRSPADWGCTKLRLTARFKLLPQNHQAANSDVCNRMACHLICAPAV